MVSKKGINGTEGFWDGNEELHVTSKGPGGLLTNGVRLRGQLKTNKRSGRMSLDSTTVVLLD